MQQARILVIGGGIGGLTAAIALGRRGFRVTMIERDPDWCVYGVGIIQQSNVIRAMHAARHPRRLSRRRRSASTMSTCFAPDGRRLARGAFARLVEGYPANVGIGRRALQAVLASGRARPGARSGSASTSTRSTMTATA